MSRARVATAFGLIGLIALLLLIPKFMLVTYMNSCLWASIRETDALAVGVQDLVVAVLMFIALSVLVRRPTIPRLLAGFILANAVLAFMLIDCRVRQLWLKPVDWALLRYYFLNRSDLASGTEVFFLRPAGLDMTMRRWLFFVGAAELLLWGLLAMVVRQHWRRAESELYQRPRKLFQAAAAAVPVALLAVACWTPRFIYRAEQNALTRVAIDVLSRSEGTLSESRLAADRFEQKLRPLSEVLRPSRVRLAGTAPFRNVVIVFLESFRWQDFELPGDERTPTPVLSRLAREGLAGKYYVGVPHSCKSHFSTLAGRYPSLGLEIREGMSQRSDSVLWCLREQLGAATYAFSIQNLEFENLRGILRALGVDRQVSPRELAAAAGMNGRTTSSFGADDAALVDAPGRILAAGSRPFAAVVLPIGAHYPYYFDAKTDENQADMGSYRRSMTRTDEVIGRMLQDFQERSLMQDTLFVLLGDHGESFGEHGTFVHNNSMYEEEISAPLLFWSADGRMRDPIPLVARQIDVAPTIADLCGVTDASYRCQGESVLRQERPGTVFASSFFDGVGQTLIDGTEKYIAWPQNDRMVRFDLSVDPRETQPLPVTESEKQRILGRLRAFAAYQDLLFRTPEQR